MLSYDRAAGDCGAGDCGDGDRAAENVGDGDRGVGTARYEVAATVLVFLSDAAVMLRICRRYNFSWFL